MLRREQKHSSVTIPATSRRNSRVMGALIWRARSNKAVGCLAQASFGEVCTMQPVLVFESAL